MNDDPFEALKNEQAKDHQRSTPGSTAALRQSTVDRTVAQSVPPKTTTAAVDPPEQVATDAREILHGIYVDEAMDNFITAYVDRRLDGTRRRPSRSLVGYWLLTIAKAALEERGMPPMPAEFAKRRSGKE